MPTSQSSLGPALVGLGLLLVVGGVIAWAGGFAWFGRLPGDLRWERGSVRIFAPLASMLVLSLVATVVLWVARRFLP